MKPEEVYAIWSPPDSIWARWSKPVIFAQLKPNTELVEPEQLNIPDLGWLPRVHHNTAVIVNLASGESVAMGLELAARGYRPVPLYNCADGHSSVVPINRILGSLLSTVERLQAMPISPDAPPAFLVDSNRLQGVIPPAPGRFDNRWVLFPQDFPSATFLKSREINRVLVLQRRATLEDDMIQVLYPMQKAGIEILLKDPFTESSITPITVQSPSGYRRWYLWYAVYALSLLGLRRNSAGGFGSRVPMPSSGGG